MGIRAVVIAALACLAMMSVPRLGFSQSISDAARFDTARIDTARGAQASIFKEVDFGAASAESPLRAQAVPSHDGFFNALFVSTAVLQALDYHSTMRARASGAMEANPLMAKLTEHRVLFGAAKGAVAASTILLSRQLAKKNKLAAALTLVAVNSAYAMVVSQNYQISNLR